MAKRQKKHTGPNPEIRVYQPFQDRHPSVARGVNEFFMFEISYMGDFHEDFKAGNVNPSLIYIEASLKAETRHKYKGRMPMPVLYFDTANKKFEAGVKLPDDQPFIPVKESTQMTKNIRYANKTARSLRETVMKLLNMQDSTTAQPVKKHHGKNTVKKKRKSKITPPADTKTTREKGRPNYENHEKQEISPCGS